MSIRFLKITGYKCFGSQQKIDFSIPKKGDVGSGLNILIGENNSGKTAVLSTFTKLNDTSNNLFFDEERNSVKDIEIVFVHSDGERQTIKNISESSNIDEKAKNSKFPLSYSDIHYIKDNKIWVSNFNGYNTDPKSYLRFADTKRHDIDIALANVLSNIERTNPNLKKSFNECMKKIVPSFSDWHIAATTKSGSYINYEMLNGKKEDVDYSLGSGILNLFRIVIALVDDSKIVVIDEPEAYLHPLAQQKLARLFIEKSQYKQIIIATHSPFMFQEAILKNSNLMVFKRKGKKLIVQNTKTENWGLFETISPTHAEINYRAYGLVTPEFHNELYGFVQSKFKMDKSIKSYDNFLISRGDSKKKWKFGPTSYQGLSTYIRNHIHHPEQKDQNKKYTETELKRSIRFLIRLMKE